MVLEKVKKTSITNISTESSGPPWKLVSITLFLLKDRSFILYFPAVHTSFQNPMWIRVDWAAHTFQRNRWVFLLVWSSGVLDTRHHTLPPKKSSTASNAYLRTACATEMYSFQNGGSEKECGNPQYYMQQMHKNSCAEFCCIKRERARDEFTWNCSTNMQLMISRGYHDWLVYE